MVRRILIGGFLVFGMALFTLATCYGLLTLPAGGDATATLLIARGDTLRPVLNTLSTEGVLNNPLTLYAYARATGQTAIRGGEYEVTASQSPLQILETLVTGRVKLSSITFAEGLNRWQMRDRLAADRWMTAEAFDTLCDDSVFLKKHRIPGPTCEGYLYPETYTFARGVAPEKVLGAMFAAYRQQMGQATAEGAGPLDLSERELVALASIVEKETGAPEERPHIACVFYNRLKARPRWRLQTDPTVIYAATLADPSFDGNLRREHLRKLSHPYNTYRTYGLPPGPIANPGRAAMDAVTKPSQCDDFFFVSMNNGRHAFCVTLDCHNRAVRKWQINYFRRR